MNALSDLPFVTYGTTRLGDGNIPFNDRVKLALQAMDKGIAFHTSRQYGDTLLVLGQAFKQKPANIPKLMMHKHLPIIGTQVHPERPFGTKYSKAIRIYEPFMKPMVQSNL